MPKVSDTIVTTAATGALIPVCDNLGGGNYDGPEGITFANLLKVMIAAVDGSGGVLLSDGSGVVTATATLSLANGGTNAATAAAARDTLGFVSLTTLGTTGAITIDCNANTGFVLSLTGNVTLSLSNEADGRRFTLYVRGQASGYTVTWFAGLKWAGGAAPTIPTTSGYVMPIGFVRLASGEWLGIPGAECY